MTYSDSAVEGNAAFAPPTRPASQAWAACSPGQSVANPDPSYKSLLDYEHHIINHAKAYAEGNVHTNGLENFWSLLKRTLRGTYISVEPFHLFRSLDEQAFRFNTRKLSDAARFAITAGSVFGKRLTFAHLTASDASL